MSQQLATAPSTSIDTLTAEIRREHEAAQGAFRAAVEHAIRCGQLLIEAKSQVAHGGWIDWLEESFPASVRTAQGYMRLARNAEDAQALAHLGVEGALRQIAAPKEDHVEEVDVEQARELVDELGPLGTITALDRWFHGHHILSSEAKVAEVETICEIAGVVPMVEDLTTTGDPISYVWVGYVPISDGEIGNPLTYHPGWADYCRHHLGDDGVRFASVDLMPYEGARS